jgi:hypothetical protein
MMDETTPAAPPDLVVVVWAVEAPVAAAPAGKVSVTPAGPVGTGWPTCEVERLALGGGGESGTGNALRMFVRAGGEVP